MDKKRILVAFSVGGVAGAMVVYKRMKIRLEGEIKKTEKYNQLYKLMVLWMEIKQNGQSIAGYLRDREYNNIAIYGMFLVGERLYVELQDEKFTVSYGIDRSMGNIFEGIKIYKPMDTLPKTDAIVVTAVADFACIKRELEKQLDCPILSITDILNEISIM